jgi:DNA-binding transcriptional regulator YiaG
MIGKLARLNTVPDSGRARYPGSGRTRYGSSPKKEIRTMAKHMTGEQFAELVDNLELATWAQAARFFGTNERTVRRWGNGEWPVPHAVAMLLRLMAKHKITVEQAFKLGLGEAFRG